MQYQQSASPYLLLLILLLVGIPLVDQQLKNSQAKEAIAIQVPVKPLVNKEKPEPIAAFSFREE